VKVGRPRPALKEAAGETETGENQKTASAASQKKGTLPPLVRHLKRFASDPKRACVLLSLKPRAKKEREIQETHEEDKKEYGSAKLKGLLQFWLTARRRLLGDRARV